MRSRALSRVTRVAFVVSVTSVLALGPVGCGGDSSTKTGTVGELPPEIKKSNQSMEDFVKNKAAEKKK